MNDVERIRYLTSQESDIAHFDKEHRRLYELAKAFLEMDEETAENIATEFLSSAENADVKNMASSILFSLLIWQDRFDELPKYGFARNEEDAQAIMLYDPRNMEIKISGTPFKMEMPPAIKDLPAIRVQINGKEIDLLIDTGAMLTSISESVAKECGILNSDDSVEVTNSFEGTVTTKISLIDKISIGGNEFTNKFCIIVPDSAFDFSQLEKDAPRINGTVGWEIIKRLKWTIDYKNRWVQVEAPKTESVHHNMCCDFFPMVKIGLFEKELIMGLDTGAGVTHLGKCMKDSFGKLEKISKQSGGAGQIVEETGMNLPQAMVSIDQSNVELKNVWIYDDREYSMSSTFTLPGVLGSDIAKNKTMIIDFTNRHFSIMS